MKVQTILAFSNSVALFALKVNELKSNLLFHVRLIEDIQNAITRSFQKTFKGRTL